MNKRKKLFILLISFCICIISTNACTKTMNSVYEIDLSDTTDFDFNIYCNAIDELGNYTDIYFKYNNIKTEVFENMRLHEKGSPVVILEDINNDGENELIVYLQEKTEVYLYEEGTTYDTYEEKIYFINFETGNEITLNQLNESLTKYEKLEIENVEIRNAFENGKMYLSFLIRQEINETDFNNNKAFKLTSDLSEKYKDIEVQVYEDEVISNINYTYNKEITLLINNTRKDFIHDNIKIKSLNISKDKKSMLIDTKGSYIIEYKDENDDFIDDLIVICNVENNLFTEENIYYLNGVNIEIQDSYLVEIMITPENYPLKLIKLNSNSINNQQKTIAIRDGEIFYLDEDFCSVTCDINDFNNDGINEIVISETKGSFERGLYVYSEKDFKKASFSTKLVNDIIDDLVEYNVEYINNEQASIVSIKYNNNENRIKISSNTIEPKFFFTYSEYTQSKVISNQLIAICDLALAEDIHPKDRSYFPIATFEIIYEMQNDEFIVKDVSYSFNYDSFKYEMLKYAENYKFELIDNIVNDNK